MKNSSLLIGIILFCSILFSYTFSGAENKMASHVSGQVAEHEEDLDFDSMEFMETASYQITPPSSKGYPFAALFTGTMWVLLIYFILKTKKRRGEMS